MTATIHTAGSSSQAVDQEDSHQFSCSGECDSVDHNVNQWIKDSKQWINKTHHCKLRPLVHRCCRWTSGRSPLLTPLVLPSGHVPMSRVHPGQSGGDGGCQTASPWRPEHTHSAHVSVCVTLHRKAWTDTMMPLLRVLATSCTGRPRHTASMFRLDVIHQRLVTG